MNAESDYKALILLISLLFSAFFSGMEIAFLSSNRLKMELDRKRGVFASGILSIFTRNSSHFIATMLVGNNISLVIYGIITARILEPFLEYYFHIHSEVLMISVQTILGTSLILITAEFLPKNLFRNYSNLAMRLFAIPAFIIYVLLYPLTLFTIWIANFTLRYAFRFKTKIKKDKQVPEFLKADLDHLVKENQDIIEMDEEREPDLKIFRNMLEFSHLKVRDCMVPRTEIAAVEIRTPVQELKKKFIETGYSKLLVYQKSIDHIIGYVNSKELFKDSGSIRSILVPLSIVPETMHINRLFQSLIKQQKSIALVVDEYGGTSGIVTLEDIMEEIFGEIEDEHDTSEFTERKISGNEFIFSGRLEIDYLNEEYSLNLPESEEYDTLAGYIIYHDEKIPEINSSIRIGNFEIKILKVSRSKIELVHLIRLEDGK
jgi:CBS domain containing-hemolysin-like protein